MSDLLDEAIDLAIRLQNDPDNPVTHRLLAEWRGRSARHEAAWAKVAALHGLAGQAMGRRRSAPTRRAALLGLGAIGAGAVVWPALRLRVTADHMTAKAEQQLLDLPDGSILALGPRSAVAVDFTETNRIVHLLEGMIYVTVASDAPLLVTSGDLTASARVAGFEVWSDTGTVGVASGAVTASTGDAGPRMIDAGEWFRAGDTGQLSAAGVASWRENLLLADDEPLGILAGRVSRWLPGRVVVAGTQLAETRISGVFDLGDPDGALAAAVAPTGARIRHVSPWLRVIA